MNYRESLDYMFAKLPMYQRIGKTAFKKDLTNIIALCEALGNPHKRFKSIHLAGTNGKGSTSHILSAIYQNNGYKVGLYTSPHLVDFRERIKINGTPCSKDFVVQFVNQHQNLIETIQPSFFEITVAMAFLYFAEQKVDVAIIETGLGGRLDSTNIITPLLSVITSIGLDHTDMLGDTIELITREKAGIIKPEIPVVIGRLPEEAQVVVEQTCREQRCKLHHCINEEYATDLRGSYQQINIGTAMQVVNQLQAILPTTAADVTAALLNVSGIAQFYGRWQTLSTNPHVLCDVGHNEEGFRYIRQGLNELRTELHLILGFVKDKDLKKIAPLLPQASSISFVKPEVVRGMEAEEAKRQFAELGVEGNAYNSLSEAINWALNTMKNSANKASLFIGGSNFVVADLLTLKQQNNTPF